MEKDREAHIAEVLQHLYISPLEACNLCCKMCYTTKTSNRLTNADMLDFISRYAAATPLQTITFCGGEVFLLPDFPDLVNRLDRYFVQIITNGTQNRLKEITHPNLVNLIVSIDGLPEYHDFNRGPGKWEISLAFMKQARDLGFHLEVFSIVTRENMSDIPAFEARLQSELETEIPVTYHPRKPMAYLTRHPVSNQIGTTENASFLTPADRQALAGKIFPDPNLGCYQISVMSDRQVYGCCEGIRPLGSMGADIPTLINTFRQRVAGPGLGCVEPDFVCGLEEYVS